MKNKDLAIQIKKGSKRYIGTFAVKEVDFEAYYGEVHAIVGENGAGKSTLVKMLAGLFNDYTGQILINGEEIKLYTPLISKNNGIGMVYQELSLARPLSVAENILAGRLPVKNKFMLDQNKMIKETKNCLKRVGLNINPLNIIEEISQHEAQLVELAKVLGENSSIIIMDEPTSALSIEEVERLFNIIGSLRKQGLAIIYISHHLSEVLRIADRVTVLRDGKKIDTKLIKDTNIDELIIKMTGKLIREDSLINKKSHRKEKRIGKRILSIKDASRFGFFHKVSFDIKAGEILGFYGLKGSGRSELARSICGIDPLDEGIVQINNKNINTKDMGKILQYGLGYLPEDRANQGLFLKLSIFENIISASIQKLGRRLTYSKAKGIGIAKGLIEKLRILPPSLTKILNSLSGGNQQKVLLAKWLALSPRVLIVDEPTRGVDIGAKSIIHDTIYKIAKKEGKAIMLISSDLPELITLSDRIKIMRKGHLIFELPKDNFSEERCILAANGEINRLGI